MKTNTPHIHAEVIKAWADGKQVQYYHQIDGWIDVEYPSFVTTALYRIKPETLKYRVALKGVHTGKPWTTTSDNPIEALGQEQDIFFTRWITDWIEVEI